MIRSRRQLRVLIALLAALSQLWLGAAHAFMGVSGGSFCGDGNPRSEQRLLEQLPPELRMPIGGTNDCCDNGACKYCAPLCSPVLPSVPVAVLQVPRPTGYAPVLATQTRYTRPRPHKPHATGPPVMLG